MDCGIRSRLYFVWFGGRVWGVGYGDWFLDVVESLYPIKPPTPHEHNGRFRILHCRGVKSRNPVERSASPSGFINEPDALRLNPKSSASSQTIPALIMPVSSMTAPFSGDVYT